MSDKIIAGSDCLMYKGKPLVRNNDSFCYGNMTDKCVLFMQVMTYREANGEQIPDKVLVQILKTDNSLSSAEKIVKQDIKNGLYEALDIGSIWLERNLAK